MKYIQEDQNAVEPYAHRYTNEHAQTHVDKNAHTHTQTHKQTNAHTQLLYKFLAKRTYQWRYVLYNT